MKRHLVVVALVALAAPGLAWAQNKSGKQWSPYLEWSYTNSSTSGNAYDLIATATFTHSGSGEKHTTQMFHDGGSTWKMRFTATRTGTWTFTTSSSDGDLNGKSGTVTITANADSDAHGFVTQFGQMWGWMGTDKAFVPQIVMYDKPNFFHNNPGKIDSDIQNFFGGHGFNGLHVVTVAAGWFDINQSGKGYDTISNSNPNPDRKTFEALELLITKAHAAGGMVHIWAWGDESRRQTPNKWGKNGTVDRRLQRYIAARLGPLPGWAMGYGFDLDEWVTASELKTWHDYMQQRLGWFHYLGGRPAGPNTGTNHSPYTPWNSGMDYASYEHHRPTYSVYVAALNEIPSKPVMSEDRFRVRNNVYPNKDYDVTRTRRGLYISTMAGGVANIWGYLWNGASAGGGSTSYPNKAELKTYSTFFFDNDRFVKDMVRDNGITNGYGLRRPTNRHYVLYRENTNSIQVDLSGMSGNQPAVAVDTKKTYSEINLGTLTASNQTINLPSSSDWVIAVGDFGSTSSSNLPPSVNITAPADGAAFTEPANISITATATDPDGNVTQVDFYEGSNLIGSATSSPYSVTWNGASAGSYTLTAVATDDQGATTTSAGIGLTVNASSSGNQPPVAGGQSVTLPQDTSASITLSYTDPDGGPGPYSFSIVGGPFNGSLSGSGQTRTYTPTSGYVGTDSFTWLVNDGADNSNVATVTISVTSTGGSGIVTNTSPATYVWDLLDAGKTQYVDRPYTFTSVPTLYIGLDFLMTANDDKSSQGTAWITFDVSQTVTVFIAHDDRISPKPSWMSSYVDTGDDLVSGGGVFSLYAQTFPAGTISLGGNIESGSTTNSMYTVVVAPGGGGATDTDGDGLSDSDEVNVYGTDPTNPDTDGDGMSDGAEVQYGLDPLDSDQDGNSILDGLDDWNANGVNNLTDIANGVNPGAPPGGGPGPGPTPGGGSGSGGSCGATGAEVLLLLALFGLKKRRVS